MSTHSKPLSKTVQQRQIKRLRPRHYEILTRYSQGQNQRRIAKEMGIGEQWLSVLINSPVFHEELRKRWEVEGQAFIKRLTENEQRRLNAVANIMRYGVGDPAILDQPSIFDHWKPKRNNHDDDAEGLGDLMVKAINRSRREQQAATTATPEMEPGPSTPEPTERNHFCNSQPSRSWSENQLR